MLIPLLVALAVLGEVLLLGGVLLHLRTTFGPELHFNLDGPGVPQRTTHTTMCLLSP